MPYTIDDTMNQANAARQDASTLAGNVRNAGFIRKITVGSSSVAGANGTADLSSLITSSGTAPTTNVAPVAGGNLAVV